MELYGVRTNKDATEWTSERQNAVDNLYRTVYWIESDDVVIEADFVELLYIDMEDFLTYEYDSETDLYDQLNDEAKVLRRIKWRVDEDGFVDSYLEVQDEKSS